MFIQIHVWNYVLTVYIKHVFNKTSYLKFTPYPNLNTLCFNSGMILTAEVPHTNTIKINKTSILS